MKIFIKSFIIGACITIFGKQLGFSSYETLAMCIPAGMLLGLWEANRERNR